MILKNIVCESEYNKPKSEGGGNFFNCKSENLIFFTKRIRVSRKEYTPQTHETFSKNILSDCEFLNRHSMYYEPLKDRIAIWEELRC